MSAEAVNGNDAALIRGPFEESRGLNSLNVRPFRRRIDGGKTQKVGIDIQDTFLESIDKELLTRQRQSLLSAILRGETDHGRLALSASICARIAGILDAAVRVLLCPVVEPGSNVIRRRPRWEVVDPDRPEGTCRYHSEAQR